MSTFWAISFGKFPEITLFALSQSHVWTEKRAPLGGHFQDWLGGREPHVSITYCPSWELKSVDTGKMLAGLMQCCVHFRFPEASIGVRVTLSLCPEYGVDYFSKASGEDLVSSWIKNAAPLFWKENSLLILMEI